MQANKVNPLKIKNLARWLKPIALVVATSFGVIAASNLRNAQFLMPSEYKEVKSIVNKLAEHNDLGDRKVSFTVIPGSYVGWYAEELNLCEEDSCNFYENLNPYKQFKGNKAYEINEAIRQAYLFDSIQGLSYSNGVISITRSSFKTFNSRKEYLSCLIGHELSHFLAGHIFEEDLYVSKNKKGLSESEIAELKGKVNRASEIEAQNNAALMMRNAGFPIETCLDELKFIKRIEGNGAITEPNDTHPGYDEWVSEMEIFIANEKNKDIDKTSKTDLSWKYDRGLNVLIMTPIKR